MKQAVVLAYSGGLDTSFCIPYLSLEKGMDVHTVWVNTGQFDAVRSGQLAAKALQLGAVSHKTIDARTLFYEKGIKYLLFSNALKNNTYPLSVSAERAFQAKLAVEYARELGVDAMAHGSTGAGNDQVRFDYFISVLAPKMNIIAPIRELGISRKEEVAMLEGWGFPQDWEMAKYSLNEGLWGTSIGGAETLTSMGELPEAAYPHQVTKQDTEIVDICFEKGQPTAINGQRTDPINLILKLTEMAGAYGVGRDVHVGDTITGLKGRVAFEAPAALILIKAHHLLEKHVMSKWQLYWKEQLGNWYGMLIHEAQYLDPVMRDIEAFLDNSQQHVTGTVRIRLRPYHFSIVGANSPYDMMNPRYGDYGESAAAYNGRDVQGFTKILSLPVQIIHSCQSHAEKH